MKEECVPARRLLPTLTSLFELSSSNEESERRFLNWRHVPVRLPLIRSASALHEGGHSLQTHKTGAAKVSCELSPCPSVVNILSFGFALNRG